ncbi:MAG: carotenoid 1,2-hydratase [Gammaproteobacteria bacterium]|jgi:predicted secreted hydrolase|nr:carotenoid 1,2-hydratase [Gammaproteobacteria bacterium]
MRHRLPLALCLALAGCSDVPPESLSVAEQLGGRPAEGYLRAEAPRAFRFPEDHGPHAGFRNEWWYLTGNLDGADGRRFGYQATFFRIGLDPSPEHRASPWATSEVWMAHLALSDAASATHRGSERFARGAAGLAGAATDPLRVWLEDWQLTSDDGGATWRLRAATEDFALDLALRPARAAILQGEAGLSRKSDAPGNASYYYSLPRLETQGDVTVEGVRHAVRGLSWLDREWSSSALGEDQVGWDWLALQLADGRDLMYYRLRRADGTVDPMSRGSLVDGAGGRVELGPDLDLHPVRHWTAGDGRRYPVEWTLRLPGDARPLRVAAVFDAQQMMLAVRYWEGMVDVRDAGDGAPRGRGYLELTGY